MHKNIDKFKDFLNNIKGKFSVIVLSETWIDDDKADLNSLFHIPNYSFIHEKRKTNHKGGGLGIYVHKTLDPRKSCSKHRKYRNLYSRNRE